MEQNEAYKIEFLSTALNDMSQIISAFSINSKQGAHRIREKLLKSAERLGLFPYSGVAVPDVHISKQGFRMTIVEDYLMFYKIDEKVKSVIIYRVLNGKRDYPKLFSNLHKIS